MFPFLHSAAWLAALSLLAGCHDAPRDNPFDPVLTPAVELQAALDDTAGTAMLSWSRYEGQQPFREYRVLRNEVDRKSVGTLAAIPQIEQITFADTTLAPNTAYEYRVETVNAGGYAHASAPQRLQGYAIQAVALLEVVADPQSGIAHLRWSRFTGARFEAYRVERRSGEEADFSLLARRSAVGDTSFTDQGLAPDVAYFYRITVEAAGRTWPSAPSSRVSYGLEGIQLLETQVDARTGFAGLVWTAYTGPGFEGYAVLRQQAGEDFQQVGWVTAVGDTAFADGPLTPDIDYAYQVQVHAAGRRVESNALRKNHFSLAPVRLLASQADSQAGVIRLRWGAFAGPGFAAYRVLRRLAGTDEEEVLAVLSQRTDTTYVDQGARHGVDYEYAVQVEASGQQLDSERRVSRLVLPAVQLTRAVFSASTASAALGWTPYLGPRFKAYRVERRTAALVPQQVAEIADSAATSLVDSNLAGNTEYFYKVVVLTTQDEEVESAEQRGIFHQRVGTWPLELGDEEYVRLYREGEQITALVSSPTQVRLLFFDTQGGLLEEQVLLDVPGQNIEPRSVATALNGESERLLSLKGSLAAGDSRIALLRFGVDGSLIRQEREVFPDSLPLLSGPEGIVEGEIWLQVRSSVNQIGSATPGGGLVHFDEVQVSRGAQEFFSDFFEDENLKGWDYVSPTAIVEDGNLSGRGMVVAKRDESWQDFRLEVDLAIRNISFAGTSTSVGIGIGNIGIGVTAPLGSRFFLGLTSSKQVELAWTFVPPFGSGLDVQSDYFSEPFPVLKGLPYRLGLGFAEGKVSASVASPEFWSAPGDARTRWTSLALVQGTEGEILAFTSGDQPYILPLGGQESKGAVLAAEASEVRTWGSTTRLNLGVCLPRNNQVLLLKGAFSRTTQSFRWPSGLGAKGLSEGAGQGPGEMLFPLSFDAGPDGRIYVLDAGNARIQVFDAEGKYLTQWGHRGGGEDDFDFGRGLVPEDSAGSVAVDAEGYIWVADVFNRRIERFAP